MKSWKFYFILNNQPYDGSDKAYNILRLAKILKIKERNIF